MKTKSVYICRECAYQSAKWLGKCPSCDSWNSFDETIIPAQEKKSANKPSLSTPKRSVSKLNDVKSELEIRYQTGIGELDRVLGGGIVKGSLILVGGDPGIGKSTLLLQICNTLPKDKKILYVSGEESEKQIKLRAQRLEVVNDNLYLVSETDVESVLEIINSINPDIVIVDSIQTMCCAEIVSASGSVPQVREATNAFMRIAKQNDISIFIVGHVTKDGSLAGPRVLEHMVDCVLYFEGDKQTSFRILRAVKNRFGSTNEIGVFEMANCGLVEVDSPSAFLLEGRTSENSGSSVICTMEGSRGILAEIQALVSPTGFGNPRRMSSGIDLNRVILMIAVLEKRAKTSLSNHDVYVNVAGGLKILETASDLGLCAAIWAARYDIKIPENIVFIGEVGLGGELRNTSFLEKRVFEASKLGFDTAIVPKQSLKGLKAPENFNVIPAKTLSEALSHLK
ncbi:MAG: DNA repair protein RadA [Clostridia bacterium]|nr:DNA repair protein RadA [Clostridia bacterium]